MFPKVTIALPTAQGYEPLLQLRPTDIQPNTNFIGMMVPIQQRQ
ncbi:hypothetical protein H1R20_g7090, partial [Candolleomyces eurysporus]